MKNTLNIFMLFIVLAFSASCTDYNDENFPVEPTAGWVEFTQADYLVFNDVETLNLNVDYVVPIVNNDVTVDYTIEVISGAVSGVEAGTFQATVLKDTRDLNFAIPVDPTVNQPYELRVTFAGISVDNVSLNSSQTTTEAVIKVLPRNWTANSFLVSSAETLADEAFFNDPANVRSTFDFELIEGTGDDAGIFIVDNAWGDFVAGATGNPAQIGNFPYPGELTINDDSTLIIEGTSEANPDEFPGTLEEAFEVDLVNAIDYANGVISYNLEQSLFGGAPFIVTVILTPSN